MRIVGGRLRGRRLTAPADQNTRPTTDRVRENLFNILESRYRDRLVDGHIADLYAGTGALGIEALSRGAAHAVFAEQSPAAFSILKANVADLGLQDHATLMQTTARQAMERGGPFDIILLDPPYGGDEASRALTDIATYKCVSENGIVVLETARSDRVDVPDLMKVTFQRRYGNTHLSIMESPPLKKR